MILALPQDAISDVVYIDHLAGQMFLDDAADLVRYRRLFDRLGEFALTEDDTIAYLEQSMHA